MKQHVPTNESDEGKTTSQALLDALVELDNCDTERFNELVPEAQGLLNRLLKEEPEEATTFFYAGEFFSKIGDTERVYGCYRQAVTLDPEYEAAWGRVGEYLNYTGNFEAAVIAFEKAASLAPENPVYHVLLGQGYYYANKESKAVISLRRAVELDPNQLHAYFLLGKLAQNAGNFELAKTYFYTLLEKQPDSFETYYQLVKMQAFKGNEEEIIIRLKKMIGAVPLQSKSFAFFSIAGLHELVGQFDQAFENYEKANILERSLSTSSFKRYEALIENSIESFSSDVFQTLKASKNESTQPVFIVGMMRSGTTLVEQILAAHSDVYAGEEILKIAQISDVLIDIEDGKLSYPKDIAKIPPEALLPFGNDYLEHINGLVDKNYKHITDKLPFNFMNIGLIAILFPNAKIIHCIRDPKDTCLSCYFEHFTDGHLAELTSDLGQLAEFYRLYQKMMAHWHSVLPNKIFDIHYEELVAEPETHSKALISYLGLDWRRECLQPYKNTGSVSTASMWQVRQPIYNSSVRRSDKYKAFIGALDGLRDVP